MAPGKYSWIQEYKRLLYHTPCVESEVLKQHGDQVLHVSFSHNGKMFATCSKDGFIRVGLFMAEYSLKKWDGKDEYIYKIESLIVRMSETVKKVKNNFCCQNLCCLFRMCTYNFLIYSTGLFSLYDLL